MPRFVTNQLDWVTGPARTHLRDCMRHVAIVLAAMLLPGCATNDNPPCRRVVASEFMRPHPFKGLATDRFIGVTQPLNATRRSDGQRAFKEVWELGLRHGWAVLWIPAGELPADYLAHAPREPNRPSHRVPR